MSFYLCKMNPLNFSAPIYVMILEKANAVAEWRKLAGPTNSVKAREESPNRFEKVFLLKNLLKCLLVSGPCTAKTEAKTRFMDPTRPLVLPEKLAFFLPKMKPRIQQKLYWKPPNHSRKHHLSSRPGNPQRLHSRIQHQSLELFQSKVSTQQLNL
jgi:hypothetical protein